MIGIAQRHGADAVRLGPPDHVPGGMGGQHLAHAVMAVDHADGADIDDIFRRGDRLGDTGFQPRRVPWQAHDAMGLMAPEIGLDQRVGGEMGVRRRHAGLDIDGGREFQ